MKTQKILTYVFICLLLASLAVFSLVGVQNDYPSILDMETGNLTFSDGSRVFLTFENGFSADEASLNSALEDLTKRFDAVGYSDAGVTALENGTIQVDVPITSFVTDRVEALTGVGKFQFSSAFNENEEPFAIAPSDIKSVQLSASTSGYYVVVTFTEAGSETFSGYAKPLSNSGVPYMMVSVDEDHSAIIDLKNNYYGDTVAFASSEPSVFLAALSSDPLPAAMEVASVETLPATLSGAARWIFIICCAVLCIALFALLIVKAKAIGVFASLALIGDVLVFMIAIANYRFTFSVLSLCVIAVILLLAWAYYYFICSRAGKAIKEQKSASFAFNQFVKPLTLRTLFIHIGILFIGILLLMFMSGVPLLIDRVLLWGALGNCILYFAVFYLGSKTAVNA